MNRSRSGPRTLTALLGTVAIVVAACGGDARPPPHRARPPPPAPRRPRRPPPPPSPSRPAPITADAPGPNGGVVVRWFVGLGAGGKPAADRRGAEVRRRFQRSPSKDSLHLARDLRQQRRGEPARRSQIAAGNPPDIIGPVGVEGLNIFRDNLLDLAAAHRRRTNFDMTKFDPALVDFFKIGKGGATIGVPVRDLPVVHLLQQEAVRRGQAAVPADQGRRPVRRQALGHGRRPRRSA